MRRSIAAAFVVCIGGLLALSSGGTASTGRAHLASTVPIVVAKSRSGETAAIARVVIHGHAYPFLIDTGATKTSVDVALVRKLKLRFRGKPVKITGVGCNSIARYVRLTDWRIGNQPLPAVTAATVKLPGVHGKPVGLLGSDVLSRFGAIALDYQRATLTLG